MFSAITMLTVAASACAGPEVATSDEELRSSALDKYGMSVGVAATGAEARALYAAIKQSGGKALDEHRVLAGLTALELGLAKQGDDDADEAFGISCQEAAGDSTFHADTCSLFAVVEASGQQPDATILSGKLAKAVAQALPRTSPEGLVGSTTTGSGPVSCKTIPGPAGSKCTVRAFAVFSTFKAMTKGSDGEKLDPADANKAIKAFFPGS